MTSVPRPSHSSMHWRSSHIPFTFFRKQMDLPTPPRFVKFIPRASSLTQGAVRTVPTSDHVPELMKPQSSPLAGIAAIADAVSWHGICDRGDSGQRGGLGLHKFWHVVARG